MSVAEGNEVVSQALPTEQRPFGLTLWVRQVQAILKMELRKTIFGRRSLPVYLLAGLPVAVLVFANFFGGLAAITDGNLGEGRSIFAGIFMGLVLGAVIFFGCAGIFTNLFRGEMLDRSLHYYMLSPLRRDVLVAGKYLAGLLTTVTLFVGATFVSYCLFMMSYGLDATIQDFTSGPGLTHLVSYMSVALLACVGYGALFLILGLLFKNPILPIGALLVWEFFHFLLPPALKKLSVIHYLKGLVPIPETEGPLAIVTVPPPAWVSVSGLLLLTAVALVLAAFRLRQIEVRYSED